MSDGAMLAAKTITVVAAGPVATVSPTPAESTPVPTATPTPSPTRGADTGCVGDCDAGGSVSVDELVRGVNIALGNSEATACASFDVDSSGRVTVDELVRAVNAALTGCGRG